MDFPKPALPLNADCFAELNQFNTGHQTCNIKKEESNYYAIKIFKKVTSNDSLSLH